MNVLQLSVDFPPPAPELSKQNFAGAGDGDAEVLPSEASQAALACFVVSCSALDVRLWL